MILFEINLQFEIFPDVITESKLDLEREGYVVPRIISVVKLVISFLWIGIGLFNYNRYAKFYKIIGSLAVTIWIFSFVYLIKNRFMLDFSQFTWSLIMEFIWLLTISIVIIRQIYLEHFSVNPHIS